MTAEMPPDPDLEPSVLRPLHPHREESRVTDMNAIIRRAAGFTEPEQEPAEPLTPRSAEAPAHPPRLRRRR